jgi:hypothetical protein
VCAALAFAFFEGLDKLKITALLLTVALIVTSTGCAVAPVANTNYSLIDPKGVDMGMYDQDYRECAALANQTDVGQRAVGGAAGGAIIGALFGALLGAAIGGSSGARYGAGVGAAAGGSQGAIGGAASGANEQQMALRSCLGGRGYNVIR